MFFWLRTGFRVDKDCLPAIRKKEERTENITLAVFLIVVFSISLIL